MQEELAAVSQSSAAGAASHEMIFRQLFDEASSTFTYILADKDTKEAVIIDPVLEQV